VTASRRRAVAGRSGIALGRAVAGLRQVGARRIAIAVGLLLVAGGGWLWLRDSPLVSVKRVTVSGASGPDAPAIRAALISAARGMTTLDVSLARLRAAVSPYPEVRSLKVGTDFPHGLRIHVLEQLPVAVVELGGRMVGVAADGLLLRIAARQPLPRLPLAVPPGGPRVSQQRALAVLKALAAAPYRLLARISQATELAGHGVVAQLRGGPAIYLGGDGELRAKWLAALAVLADPSSAGASYIDVTDPARPAAGSGGG
jgi:cell division protein FtsQ